MKVLFIGDIIGKIGRRIGKSLLPDVVNRYKIDVVIANGENIAGGFGITEKTAMELFSCGVHIITTGNHVWDKKEAIPYIAKESNVLRPINYPVGTPGVGSVIFTPRNNTKVAVINISGRVFMNTLDCPFRIGKAEVERLRESTNIIVVDFHAEATSEKIAFGYYIDGMVSAVIGTHTHVQTADEQILPDGTAYITDVGMTGPQMSVIGIKKEQIIERFLSQMPIKYEIAKGNVTLSAVIIEINEESGKAIKIERLQLTDFQP
ncbi:TIGR00282 family metallophosphoesterase [Thermodesulfovibrionales bacterium]|nr:TIGR00282 family metallophosphoesterase [Thermodesulfovibrionales bacterium]